MPSATDYAGKVLPFKFDLQFCAAFCFSLNSG